MQQKTLETSLGNEYLFYSIKRDWSLIIPFCASAVFVWSGESPKQRKMIIADLHSNGLESSTDSLSAASGKFQRLQNCWEFCMRQIDYSRYICHLWQFLSIVDLCARIFLGTFKIIEFHSRDDNFMSKNLCRLTEWINQSWVSFK